MVNFVLSLEKPFQYLKSNTNHWVQIHYFRTNGKIGPFQRTYFLTVYNVATPDDCGGCAAPTPVCDTVSGECYECVVDSDCPAEKPDCDLGEHVCKPGRC